MLTVTKKQLSNGLEAVLLNLDGQDGMTFPEVVRVLGIPKQTIISFCGRNHVQFGRIQGQIASTLRKDNVIPLRGAPPSFVPQEVIKQLVRFYSNEQTDAIYKQLWDVAEAVHSGDYITAGKTVGASDDKILDDLIAAVEFARKMKNERDQERAEKERKEGIIKSNQANAVSFARSHGLVSREIAEIYPIIAKAALKWFDKEFSGDTVESKRMRMRYDSIAARITIFLKSVFGLEIQAMLGEMVKTQGKKDPVERAVYNLSDIEAINEKLKKEQSC